VKLCCQSCLKDFNKEPAKYFKKIGEEAKKSNPFHFLAAAVWR